MTETASWQINANRLHARAPEFLGLLQFRPLRFGRCGIVLKCRHGGGESLCLTRRTGVARAKRVLSFDQIVALGSSQLCFELVSFNVFGSRFSLAPSPIVIRQCLL